MKNDLMKAELEISPFIKKEIRKTLIEPIIEKRLSEKMENNQLTTMSEPLSLDQVDTEVSM